MAISRARKGRSETLDDDLCSFFQGASFQRGAGAPNQAKRLVLNDFPQKSFLKNWKIQDFQKISKNTKILKISKMSKSMTIHIYICLYTVAKLKFLNVSMHILHISVCHLDVRMRRWIWAYIQTLIHVDPFPSSDSDGTAGILLFHHWTLMEQQEYCCSIIGH